MRNHPSQSFQFAVRSPGTDSWHPQRHPNFTKWLGQPGCKQRQRDWLECHSWNGRKSATFTALLCMFHSSKHVPIDQTTSWTTSINYHLSIVYIIIISVISPHRTPRKSLWLSLLSSGCTTWPTCGRPGVPWTRPGPKCMSYSITI